MTMSLRNELRFDVALPVLHMAADSYDALANPNVLGKPKTGFRWKRIAKNRFGAFRTWPLRRGDFVEEYAGKLVGFACLILAVISL